MTKFIEFNDVEKDFLKKIQMLTLQSKIKEESELTRILLRLLILGNGSGIVLLSAFMGVIAAYGIPVSTLVYPLWMFLFGSIFGASIYFPLASVAVSALNPSLSRLTKLSIFVNKLTSINNARWHYKFYSLSGMIILPTPPEP